MDSQHESSPDFDVDLPAYTPAHAIHECDSNSPGPSAPSQSNACYEYDNGALRLNLGRKRNASFRPAYGWNALVEGFVEMKKETTNVQSITVSIEGYVTTGWSERGFLTDLTKTRILHLTQTLFDISTGQCCPSRGDRYSFSIPLPSYVSGGTEPLPPTFSAIHLGAAADVTYSITVDMVRKGFLRQNTKLKAFFFYLPRTYVQSPRSTSCDEKSGCSIPWHVCPIAPQQPQTPRAGPSSSPPDLDVSVAFPRQRVYATGSAIPFSMKVAGGPAGGALPLLFSGISVQLIRLTMLKVRGKQTTQTNVLGCGEVYRIEDQGDVRTMFGSVPFRKQGESSWAVPGIEVKHVVRVTLGPRADVPSLMDKLPKYVHEETMTLRTHEMGRDSGEDEHEPEWSAAPRVGSCD